jgi:hypothetical protein
VARIKGLEITYRLGPRRYRRAEDASDYLCAPIEQFPVENCPGDAEGQFDNVVIDFFAAR